MFDGEHQKRLERYKKVAAEFYTTFVGNGQGTFVLDYLKRSFIMRPSFDVKRPDDRVTMYREGERALALAILQWIEWHEQPEKLEQWLKQHKGVEA